MKKESKIKPSTAGTPSTEEGKKKRKTTTRPTPRQKAAFIEIELKKRRAAPVLRELNYAHGVVSNPQQVTQSKGYLLLKEDYIQTLESIGIDKVSLAKRTKDLMESRNEKIALGAVKHVVNDVHGFGSDQKQTNFYAPVQIVIKKL